VTYPLILGQTSKMRDVQKIAVKKTLGSRTCTRWSDSVHY